MQRKKLAELIEKKTKISKKICGQILKAMTEIMTQQFLKGESFSFSNFGTIGTCVRKSRRMHFINKTASVIVPERIAVRFKSSRKLKAILNPKVSL